MSLEQKQAGSAAVVDVKLLIPELVDVSAFWIRQYETWQTFADLYQECVGHPEVLRSRVSFARSRASRHFWYGERMALRSETLAEVVPTGSGEVSLVLRPDYYQVGPAQYLAGSIEYTYLDAEAPTGEIVAQILSREEKPCCFDLCSLEKKRLAHEKTLADFELWPAWQDAPPEAFPPRARLLLRPRTSWLPWVLWGAAALLGVLIGYLLLSLLLRPH